MCKEASNSCASEAIKPDTSLYKDTPSRLRTAAVVAEAHAAGKTVQIKAVFSPDSTWRDVRDPAFSSPLVTDYRIKPEPREWWVNMYADGTTGSLYETETKARAYSGAVRTFKVREVID